MTVPNWSAFTPQIGEVSLLDIDIGGPGPFALVSGPGVISNVGHMGRNSFYGEFLEGWDPILGAGEFAYVQAAASVVPGQIVQFAAAQDSNNNLVLQVTPWTGTANSGYELGVAISAIGTNQWGWVQVSGMAIALHGGTASGQTVNSATISGQVATITTASAHGLVVGQPVNMTGFTPSQFNGSYAVVSVPTTTTFTVQLPVTNLPANNATVQGSYTYYAGTVTGQTVSSITVAGTTATLTTSSAHGLQVGDSILVSGATGNTSVNGQWTVGAVTSTTVVTYTGSTITTGVVTGGTYIVNSPAVNGQAYYAGNGSASGVIVASKHLLSSQWAVGTSIVAGQLGSTSQGRTLKAWEAVLWIGRPTAQGAIT